MTIAVYTMTITITMTIKFIRFGPKFDSHNNTYLLNRGWWGWGGFVRSQLKEKGVEGKARQGEAGESWEIGKGGMSEGGLGKSSLFVFVCCVFLFTCPIPPFLIPPFPFSRERRGMQTRIFRTVHSEYIHI